MNRRYFLLLLLFFELLVIFQLSSRIVSILQTDSRIQTTRLQRDILKKEYQSKMYAYSYVRTDLYVEEIARAKLRYGYPNEQMYIISEDRLQVPTLPQVEIVESASPKWWGEMLNWYSLFFT
jgi:cell division protein FtsB